MADRVDKLLFDYFSGNIQRRIKARKLYLTTKQEIDENIGGGRAQYKYSNAVESMMITEERDVELQDMNHKIEIVELWLDGLDDDHKTMLKMHYGQRCSWLMIERKLNVSEVTLHKWKNEFKDSVWPYVNVVGRI